MKILVIGRQHPVHPDEIMEEAEIAKSLGELENEVGYAHPQNYKEMMGNDFWDVIFIAKQDLDWEFVFSQKGKAKIAYWMPDHCYLWEMESKWQQIALEADVWIGCDYGNIQWALDNFVNYFYWKFDVGCSVHQRNTDPVPQQDYSNTPYPDVVPIGFIGNWVHNEFRTNMLKDLQSFFPTDLHITTQSLREMSQKLRLDNIHNPLFAKSHNALINITKINLCIENTIAYGFWSNRIGKILCAGGFVLAYYIKGMEKVFGDNIEYFTTVGEAVEKINYWLAHDEERIAKAQRSYEFAQTNLRPINRTKELMIYFKTL